MTIIGTAVIVVIMAGFGIASAQQEHVRQQRDNPQKQYMSGGADRSAALSRSGYGYGPGCGYGDYCPPPCDGDYCSPGGGTSCGPGDGAVIDNGTIQLGVCKLGDLNVPNGGPPSSGEGTRTVGLRYLPTNADAISPGCQCEGWGAADVTTGVTGFADQSTGDGGLVPIGFSATASTAVSKVAVGNTLEVTQDYHPSDSSRQLFEDTVTIKNVSAAAVSPRYRRVMDWDVEPTAFDEFVTIDGGSASGLLFDSDDGFASANPLGPRTKINFTGNAVDNGPIDHGALFDFGFDALAPGSSRTFTIYYGAAATETEALASVTAVGAEVYSLGQPSTEHGPDQGTPNTFIFAFSGVGGSTIRTALALDPTTATKTVGETHHITATLLGTDGAPLADKRLVATITGANATTPQVATTNAEGRAAIEYVGAHTGSDQLAVFADANANSQRDDGEPQAFASVTWDVVDVVSNPTPGPVGDSHGTSIEVGHYTNPATGLDYFTIPAGVAASQPGGCLQLPLTFTIHSGDGELSNVQLVLRRPDGSQQLINLDRVGATNQFTGVVPCAHTATMDLDYDLTEGNTTQHFNVPVGGIVLIDPSGIVYDKRAYDLAVCGGASSTQAIAGSKLEGATVKLQRKNADGSFSDVLSGDPGIAPNVNPETTASSGHYAWDVDAGGYRTVVTKGGYATATSRTVTIPPAVTDLDIAMLKNGDPATTTCPAPAAGGNQSTGGDAVPTPAASAQQLIGKKPAGASPAPAVFCRVPKLKGKTAKHLAASLKAAHCKLGKRTKRHSKKIKKGRIITSSPAAGKRLRSGATVNVVLSSGRASKTKKALHKKARR